MMEPGELADRRVLLHVTGGVAAVKVPQLITELRRGGAEVRAVMTAAATTLVAPLSLQALSGHPVARPGGGALFEAGMAHLDLASWPDCHLVVPATADVLARLAAGMAGDLVTATLLATTAPVVLAPAMETGMWENPATRANVRRLRDRGMHLVGPVSGRLASGREGLGRMAEPDQILAATAHLLRPRGELTGVGVLVTAGGTREPLDPVRYLGNRSSGRMGLELARAAARRGATVHLVTAADVGPTEFEVVRVDTAEEMLRACLDRLSGTRLVLMAAAVADYRLDAPAAEKVHRSERPSWKLELVANVDVLDQLLRSRPEGCRVVGFAAETADVRQRGRDKLERKGCDMLVANPVAGEHSAMGGENAEAVVLMADGREVELPYAPKRVIAGRILDLAAALLSPAEGELEGG